MGNAGRILLVEDHSDTSAALHQILTARGYSVVTADTGQEALDVIDSGVLPRLVVIDLMLPNVSGWDVLKYLQSDTKLRHIPTVVITGLPKDQVRVVADVIFHKPLDFAKVIATIDSLIARH